jgi:hypothetical protein
MCHAAHRQYPTIRCDALCLYCYTVGSGQLFWCLENRFRSPTGTGAGKGETFFQVLIPDFDAKHHEMLSSVVVVINRVTMEFSASYLSRCLPEQHVLAEPGCTEHNHLATVDCLPIPGLPPPGNRHPDCHPLPPFRVPVEEAPAVRLGAGADLGFHKPSRFFGLPVFRSESPTTRFGMRSVSTFLQ